MISVGASPYTCFANMWFKRSFSSGKSSFILGLLYSLFTISATYRPDFM